MINKYCFTRLMNGVREFDKLSEKDGYDEKSSIFYDVLSIQLNEIFGIANAIHILEHIYLPEEEREKLFKSDDELYDFVSIEE